MKRIIKLLNRNFFQQALFGVFIIFLFLANTFHESYPDEFDNILGGWFILQGKLPFTGFFTHHGPIPYFIAALVEIFSGQSFVRFRILYSLFLIGWFIFTYYLLRKSLGEQIRKIYLLFIIFIGFLATYYWSHMLLADNIAAFVYLPVYILIVFKVFYKKLLSTADIIIIASLFAIGLYSSLTYTYLYLIIFPAVMYLVYQQQIKSIKFMISKKFILPILIFAIPHALFIFYLILTKSFGDYYFQNFTFNVRYYIYNYPRDISSNINPVRYAILIFNDFYNNFHALLAGFNQFNFGNPLNVTMAVGNTVLLLYLIFKKQYKLTILILLILVYSNVRSNPLTSRETDYQSAVYIYLSFLNIFFVLPNLYLDINKINDLSKKIIFSVLLLLTSFYFVFSLLFIVRKFNEKVFPKYMGKMPLIYDRPRFTPLIETVTDKDDYAWIGPFEFEELFHLNRKIPSKYHILIRGIGLSEKMRNEMLSDFNTNMPKVILFDKDFTYITYKAYTYSDFFLDFLNQNYIKLSDVKKRGDLIYFFPDRLYPGNLADILYIRKDSVDQVVKILLQKNYIK
ncbi:MAG: hypothetical protein HYT08_01540 [Candidatus Levybacteria bacterium]|nr:hypothetical protein [Candidatus Levybacteria bacterium]